MNGRSHGPWAAVLLAVWLAGGDGSGSHGWGPGIRPHPERHLRTRGVGEPKRQVGNADCSGVVPGPVGNRSKTGRKRDARSGMVRRRRADPPDLQRDRRSKRQADRDRNVGAPLRSTVGTSAVDAAPRVDRPRALSRLDQLSRPRGPDRRRTTVSRRARRGLDARRVDAGGLDAIEGQRGPRPRRGVTRGFVPLDRRRLLSCPWSVTSARPRARDHPCIGIESK